MPLWAAGLLLILCVPLSVASFKYYRNGAGKIFLAEGIFFLLVFLAAVVYIIAAVLLVSEIK
jgi:hypothetical protein